jgi:hypothetical protein
MTPNIEDPKTRKKLPRFKDNIPTKPLDTDPFDITCKQVKSHPRHLEGLQNQVFAVMRGSEAFNMFLLCVSFSSLNSYLSCNIPMCTLLYLTFIHLPVTSVCDIMTTYMNNTFKILRIHHHYNISNIFIILNILSYPYHTHNITSRHKF